MVDSSMQSCEVAAEFRESHTHENEGLFEEQPLFVLEKLYSTPEEKKWLQDNVVASRDLKLSSDLESYRYDFDICCRARRPTASSGLSCADSCVVRCPVFGASFMGQVAGPHESPGTHLQALCEVHGQQ